MPGGSLFIEIGENGQVYTTGPIEGICEGRFHKDIMEKILKVA